MLEHFSFLNYWDIDLQYSLFLIVKITCINVTFLCTHINPTNPHKITNNPILEGIKLGSEKLSDLPEIT